MNLVMKSQQKKLKNDSGDRWNDEDYYDLKNNVENEEQPIK